MGAVFYTHSFEACSTDELKQKFREYQAEEAYEYGNSAYNGRMSQSAGLVISSQVFKDENAAYNWLDNNTSKRGAAVAVKVGEFKPLFPVTAKDKKLVDTYNAIKIELEEFDIEVTKRAKAQKSTKKTCTHCGSVISLKHLELPKKWSAERYSDFAPAVTFMGQYYVTSMRKLTDCPVCSHNLLMTDTDKKRKESLEVKFKELAKKVNEARNAYNSKLVGKQGYWLVGACCGE